MSDVFENKGAMAATIVVAASDSVNKAAANYVCDSTDDHIEIQAALDALPDTGGEVFLLDGTYNIEVALVLDSYQTLRGCGRNTILTTTTADVDIITAIGGDGSEKIGILIADLCVDGNAGGEVNDVGILWTYVDYSKIINVWSLDNGEQGIYLLSSDNNIVSDSTSQRNAWWGIDIEDSSNNIISGNTCQGNTFTGIPLSESSNHNTINSNTCQGNGRNGIGITDGNHNTISGNTCQGNSWRGIELVTSNNNTVSSNTCQGNAKDGIYLNKSSNNTVSGNTCWGNGRCGIYLYSNSNNNAVSGNTCVANSQSADSTYDNILLENSDYNLISSNICRAPTIGTTLTVGEVIGATDIRVTDESDFEVGMGVVIDLGGGNEEYHRIVAIAAGVITIDAGLTNNQALGETIDVPEAQYGINVSAATCDFNMVHGNNLYDSGKTGDLNDLGTNTRKRDNLDDAGAWLGDV